MAYLLGYFTIGEIASVIMHQSGMHHKAYTLAKLQGIEMDMDTITWAIAIGGVLLWPILLVGYAADRLKQ